MSSTALTAFDTTVDRLIQDTQTVLDTDDIGEQIKIALSRYSYDKPHVDVVEFAGDGGKYYAISTSLTNWRDGFSNIQAVEYPAATIASDEAPRMLEPEDFAIFETATAKYLYFPSHTPTSSYTVRVWYTDPYLFAGSPEACDIRDEDYYAICWLAAASCCDLLAANFATHVDVADGQLSVKRDKLVDKYLKLSAKYLKSYLAAVNLPKDDSVAAAGAIGEWDLRPFGQEYIYHRDSTR